MSENNDNNNNQLALSNDFKNLEAFIDSAVKVVKKEGDEDQYKILGKTFSSKEDILATLALGNEMGLSPASSIIIGNDMNTSSAMQAILMGRSMGLDALTSIRNIYPIKGVNGYSFKTGVHIVEGQLAKVNVKLEILEDNVPAYKYYTPESYIIREDEFKEMDDLVVLTSKESNRINLLAAYRKDKTDAKLKAIIANMQADDILTDKLRFTDDKLNSSFYLIKEDYPTDRRTTIQFTRPSNNTTIKISYTLQQAIDANLHIGRHSRLLDDAGTFIISKGKSNWHNHPETMLRNFVISTGGNIIAGDVLNGIYTDAQAAGIESVEESPTVILN